MEMNLQCCVYTFITGMKDYTYFKASFQYAVLGMMMMLEKYHLLRAFF